MLEQPGALRERIDKSGKVSTSGTSFDPNSRRCSTLELALMTTEEPKENASESSHFVSSLEEVSPWIEGQIFSG
jgi:hypothetical protein